jgi:hypothetical protein
MTGTTWNGHRFFGLLPASRGVRAKAERAIGVGRPKDCVATSRGQASQVYESDALHVRGSAQGVLAHGLVAAGAEETSLIAIPAMPPPVDLSGEINSDRLEASP